jgi:hypothetical protein
MKSIYDPILIYTYVYYIHMYIYILYIYIYPTAHIRAREVSNVAVSPWTCREAGGMGRWDIPTMEL